MRGSIPEHASRHPPGKAKAQCNFIKCWESWPSRWQKVQDFLCSLSELVRLCPTTCSLTNIAFVRLVVILFNVR